MFTPRSYSMIAAMLVLGACQKPQGSNFAEAPSSTFLSGEEGYDTALCAQEEKLREHPLEFSLAHKNGNSFTDKMPISFEWTENSPGLYSSSPAALFDLPYDGELTVSMKEQTVEKDLSGGEAFETAQYADKGHKDSFGLTLSQPIHENKEKNEGSPVYVAEFDAGILEPDDKADIAYNTEDLIYDEFALLIEEEDKSNSTSEQQEKNEEAPAQSFSSASAAGSTTLDFGEEGGVLNSEELGTIRGTFTPNQANLNLLEAIAAHNNNSNSVTGDNVISGETFNDTGGVVSIIQNTGNNTIIQNATIVNLNLD